MPHDSPICATISAAQAEGVSEDELDRRVWARHGTTCAMLALDSSGMTRISRRRGIVRFLARYVQMRDSAQAVLERNECLRWRCFADNLFAEFAHVDPAYRAASEIHAALRDSGLQVAEAEPYRVCLAIGYGRVLSDGPFGVMGDEMNVTAKLAEDVAEAGETLLTEAAFRALTLRAPAAEKMETTLSQVALTFYRVSA
jgi:adenylate cyclase